MGPGQILHQDVKVRSKLVESVLLKRNIDIKYFISSLAGVAKGYR